MMQISRVHPFDATLSSCQVWSGAGLARAGQSAVPAFLCAKFGR